MKPETCVVVVSLQNWQRWKLIRNYELGEMCVERKMREKFGGFGRDGILL
jgi:hypothetical protein